MAIEQPYLMFLGDATDKLAAKVAIGVNYWRPEWCKGQLSLDGCAASLNLPEMTVKEAIEVGCKTMIIGIANRGGTIPDSWVSTILEALNSGLDVASGLHSRLVDIPAIYEAATNNGRKLADVRHSNRTFQVANGLQRAGKRPAAGRRGGARGEGR